MRLDRMLSNAHAGTRSQVKKLVKEKRVKVNGVLAKTSSMQIDEVNDEVTLDGIPVIYEEHMYLMLHKPAGYISATEGNVPTVMDLIYEDNNGLFPCGRLDKDTEGLLLLTDDGIMAHELLSPRKHVDKVYFAKVSGQFGENEIARFKEGLDIGNGERSKQARLQILKADVQESEVLITIMEGKFHQVKRMVKAVGSEVLYLKRLSMGSLKLDEELKLGEYRRLTKAELQELKEHRR